MGSGQVNLRCRGTWGRRHRLVTGGLATLALLTAPGAAYASTGDLPPSVLDDASPEKPVVTSTDAPGEQYTGSVGVYAKSTADSPSDDVVAYRYTFLGGPTLTEHPAEPGGPVALQRLPLRSGPDRLEGSVAKVLVARVARVQA
ncbi:hypothetical protein [Streptomyces fradiae]|uniref:hypothetical protein n=1 Tax=Streptomyces fradiae TaxID=1906 RepID=UPI0039889C36